MKTRETLARARAQARLPRRRFLSALGLGAFAPWLGGERSARASVPDEAPRLCRFVGVYTPHGMARELWQPRAGFDIAYPGSSLAPFDDPARYGQSFRHHLLVIDGLDLAAGIEVGTVGHDASRVILTGSGAQGKNPSLDQYLALEHGLADGTPFSTLTLAVGSDDSGLGTCISYARGGLPVPKLIDPRELFAELFGGPLGAGDATALAALRRRKQSLLDAVTAELASLSRRLPKHEREKLAQHTGALREIEKRLDPPALACQAPEPPRGDGFPELRSYGGGEPFFDAISDALVDLLARALDCDLTRCASLMLADLSRTGLYPELPRDVHADVAHVYAARTDKSTGDPDTWAKLALQNRYAYGKVARLTQRLAEAGRLDETLIYVSSDMGDPARHSSRNVPTLLIGGSAAPFAFGRHLDLYSGKPEAELVPHNRLLVSIAQAFGAPIERFGSAPKASITNGRLTALDALPRTS